MSQLSIYDETGVRLAEHTEAPAIADALRQVGILFEQWTVRPELANADADTILASYGDEITRIATAGGYQSHDVVAMQPDHPQRDAMRQKFLDEHTHAEDEVRFFAAGQGLFSLHIDDRVYQVVCTAGDLLSVPAGTPHWFDMGAAPSFTAIRWFTNPDGWVAQHTGSTIAKQFPGL